MDKLKKLQAAIKARTEACATALTALYSELEIDIDQLADAAGIAYPDSTTPESGYQEAATKLHLQCVSRKLQEIAAVSLRAQEQIEELRKDALL